VIDYSCTTAFQCTRVSIKTMETTSTIQQLKVLLTPITTDGTLAVWRLSNKRLCDTLTEFAENTNDDDDKDYAKLLEHTRELFRSLNVILAEQEREYKSSNFALNFSSRMKPIRKDEFSVVFGGKYTDQPGSITEELVSKLVKDNPHVYTVSRAEIPSSALPSNVTHIQCKHLFCHIGGKGEMLNVLNTARDEWQRSYSKFTKLVVYFTLGFHNGENPFVKNMCVAGDFRDALLETLRDLKPNSWRVVFTGTDATRPSTYEDGTFLWEENNIVQRSLTIPTYKITERNYIYAMSKLGQFYQVASAVAQLLNHTDINDKLMPTIKRVHKNVKIAKEGKNSYDYLVHNSVPLLKKTKREKMIHGLKMLHLWRHRKKRRPGAVYTKHSNALIEDLNTVSKNIEDIVMDSSSLRDHFMITDGISICYTGLHSVPWTKEAVTTDDPRFFILKQIVFRLKNAVSIEQAASLHFPATSTVASQETTPSSKSLETVASQKATPSTGFLSITSVASQKTAPRFDKSSSVSSVASSFSC